MNTPLTMQRVAQYFFALLFLQLSFAGNAQIDTEFWFAAPYVNTNHAIFVDGETTHNIGGRPIYLVVSSLGSVAKVTVDVPANGHFAPIEFILNGNETRKIDLSNYVNDITANKHGGIVEQKGLHISATDNITAYYEVGAVLNPDIFSLKGNNALGTNFYTPFQNTWDNDPVHNNEREGMAADSAFSAIDIVATENGTNVWIALTKKANGYNAGDTIKITLQKGETYSVRAAGQKGSDHLTGTHIWSSKKIAVSVKDDSVYPLGNVEECEDFIGDQLVPSDMVGTEYIVMKGRLDEGDNAIEEYVFFTATEDETVVQVDGLSFSLSAGQTEKFDINTSSTSPYTRIASNKNIYCFHLSGYNCEQAGALLPPVNLCTGSYHVGFARSYGTYDAERFFMNLMVRDGGESTFLIDEAPSSVIDNATFVKIENTDWSVATLEFLRSQLPKGIHSIQNTTQPFHLAIMNSTAHNWGEDSPPRLMGSNFGYFSNFDITEPEATIVNNNDTVIAVPFGTEVTLRAGGGYEYQWTGYTLSSNGWAEMTYPYYLDSTKAYNPTINSTLPKGVYRYKAEISSACLGKTEKYLYIEVGEPGIFINLHDTVCATAPGSGVSKVEYHLNNLNNSIIDEISRGYGYYVEHWEQFAEQATVVLDDFESQRTLTLLPATGLANGTATIIDNSTEGNSSSKILHLYKTEQAGNNADEQNGVYFEAMVKDVDLEYGSDFSFKYRYDGTNLNTTGNTAWKYDRDHKVTLGFYNEYDQLIGSSTVTIPKEEIATPVWRTANVTLPVLTTVKEAVKVRVTFVGPNVWIDNGMDGFGYFFDYLEWKTTGHRVRINPTVSEIHDFDTVYAVIKNDQMLTFSDTAFAVFHVVDTKANDAPQTVTACASEKNLVQHYDLTQHNALFGSKVSDKIWYSDASLKTEVITPHDVSLQGASTFYVYSVDSCGNVGELNININEGPENDTTTLTICEVSDGGGYVNLNNYNTLLHSEADTAIWYTSETMIIPVENQTNYFVKHGDTLYAKVITEECDFSITVLFSIEGEVAVKIDSVGNICNNASTIDLKAVPEGGVFTINSTPVESIVPSAYNAGSYTLKYTYSVGNCSWADSTTIQIFDAPNVTLPKFTDNFGITDSVEYMTDTLLTAIIEGGTGNVSHMWNHPELLLNPDTISSRTVPLEDSVTFGITVIDEAGCTDSDTAFIWVWGIPVSVKLELLYNPTCIGETVPVVANVKGGIAPFRYEWNTGRSIVNGNSRRDTIWVTPTEDTKYIVSVTDLGDNDTIVIDSIILQVAEPPEIIVANSVQEVCEGSEMVLDAEIQKGNLPFTYSWQNNGTLLDDSTKAKPTLLSKAEDGTYLFQLIVRDTYGCTDTATVTALVNDLPNFSYADSLFACQNSILKAEPTMKNTYSIAWTNDTLIEKNSNDTVTIKTQSPGAYWMNYTLTTDKQCSLTDSLFIEIYEKPETRLTASPEYQGNIYTEIDVELVAYTEKGTEPYSKQWQDNSVLSIVSEDTATFILDTPQSISVTYNVTDAHGCTAQANYAKQVLQIDTIDTYIDLLVCTGTSNYTAITNKDYLVWTIEGSADYKVANDKGKNVSIEWLTAGTAIITIQADETDQNFTTPIRPYSITIEVLPKPNARIVGDRDVCEYEQREYVIADYYLTDNYTINTTWNLLADTLYINDSTINEHHDILDTLAYPNASVQWQVEDTDTLIVYVEHEALPTCNDIDTAFISIHPLPEPSFYYETVPVYSEHEVQFINTTKEKDTVPYRYFWDFIGEDLYTSEAKNPIVDYNVYGDYLAQLTVHDELWGCKQTVTDTVIVEINPDCEILFPNAFTPLKDNHTSFTHTYINGVSHNDYLLRIFNKLGTKVWETNMRDDSWNGYFDGELQQHDVYIYQCKAVCENGKEVTLTGEIMLLK